MPRFIILDGNTIHESRDPEERPKKRFRVDSEDENDPYFRVITRAFPVRDAQYYVDDQQAECVVLLLDKTLFRVSKHLFASPSVVRERLDQRGHLTSDEHPLELSGVSINEFRALLWALHASEEEILNQPKDQEDMGRLLSLAIITDKLSFAHLRNCSLSATIQAFTTNPVFADTCSSGMLSAIVETAIKLNANDLLASVITKWCDRVQRRDIPALPAIITADKHSLASLRGIAYYTHIQDILERQASTNCNRSQLFVDPKLSNIQVIRLLSGYMSLVTFWEQLRRNPLKLACAKGCNQESHRACAFIWNEQWHSAAGSEKVIRYNSADVLSILSSMRDLLCVDQELVGGVTPGCRRAGLDALKAAANDLRNDLPGHFIGCI